MRLLSIICLSVLLVTAGCAMEPLRGVVEQDRPVELVLDNSANETQTFEVWTADPRGNVSIRMNHSVSETTTIGPGLGTHFSSKYYYTTVELPDSARLHGRFTVAPSEEIRSSVEEFPRGYAVIVVLSQSDKIGWWASATCGDETLVGLEVHSRPGGPGGDAWAGYECR